MDNNNRTAMFRAIAVCVIVCSPNMVLGTDYETQIIENKEYKVFKRMEDIAKYTEEAHCVDSFCEAVVLVDPETQDRQFVDISKNAAANEDEQVEKEKNKSQRSRRGETGGRSSNNGKRRRRKRSTEGEEMDEEDPDVHQTTRRLRRTESSRRGEKERQGSNEKLTRRKSNVTREGRVGQDRGLNRQGSGVGKLEHQNSITSDVSANSNPWGGLDSDAGWYVQTTTTTTSPAVGVNGSVVGGLGLGLASGIGGLASGIGTSNPLNAIRKFAKRTNNGVDSLNDYNLATFENVSQNYKYLQKNIQATADASSLSCIASPVVGALNLFGSVIDSGNTAVVNGLHTIIGTGTKVNANSLEFLKTLTKK